MRHITTGGTKVTPPIFSSETVITGIMKFPYIMGRSFRKLRLFSAISPSFLTQFHVFGDALCAPGVKFFAEASELFKNALFHVVVSGKSASSECILQGAKKVGV